MIAYMINDYYICTSYEEVSSLVHDIVNYSVLPINTDNHLYQICKGKLNIEKQEFTLDSGLVIKLSYEVLNDIYYKVH